MLKDSDYRILYSKEMYGTFGGFGIKILVAGNNLPDLEMDSIRRAAYEAEESITAEVMAAKYAADPEEQERARAEREQMISLFPDSSSVDPIPNGYCRSWCCRHLPWYRIGTRIGIFEVGWRKRVISIDWSSTSAEASAEGLFPEESVTKVGRLIHAWSVEDARRYVRRVLDSVPLTKDEKTPSEV
jgi:hypothetical protein